jgi:thiol:disulfide interchange protein
MDRRTFLTLTALASFAVPLRALAATADYTPEALAAALADGRVVFLDFKASWCSTCAAQERVINALIKENPAYKTAITFMNVDWDTWGESAIVKEMKIPRRSTLVVLKGSKELGRLVADTSEANIRALMDTALAAV